MVESEMASTGLHIWTFGPQQGELLGEAMEPLRHGAYLAEAQEGDGAR